jgi:hypothetical protein
MRFGGIPLGLCRRSGRETGWWAEVKFGIKVSGGAQRLVPKAAQDSPDGKQFEEADLDALLDRIGDMSG